MTLDHFRNLYRPEFLPRGEYSKALSAYLSKQVSLGENWSLIFYLFNDLQYDKLYISYDRFKSYVVPRLEVPMERITNLCEMSDITIHKSIYFNSDDVIVIDKENEALFKLICGKILPKKAIYHNGTNLLRTTQTKMQSYQNLESYRTY